MADLKIGMIGLDTSHVIAFARCFNKKDHAEHIPGARVTVAYGKASPDFDLSYNRIEGFTKQLRDELRVKIVDSMEAVAEQVDLLFIMSVDGRVHREQFAQTVKFRRPTFIDKPFTTSLADAKAIFDLAGQNDVPVMSCSSLRYALPLTEALADTDPIAGCDVFGPMSLVPTLPGLFWYGIHVVEMMNRIMGRGCREVKATVNAHQDLITASWDDDKMACLRGMRKGHNKFGAVIHREKGFQFVDAGAGKKSYYAAMLEVILKTLPTGKSDVPKEDTLEIVRIIEAANKSRQSGKAETV
jgi:hypothetical protein